MTKKEMYLFIADRNSENEEIVNFCLHEIELLNRKSGTSRKLTKTQLENIEYKKAILEILAEKDKALTISEIMEDSRLDDLKNQRVSALVTQLKKEGKVIRFEEKRKAYFGLAE